MQNYKSVKKIGKGSFGYAVLVRHVAEDFPNNLYVMKLINTKKMTDKQWEEAVNEIKVLKSLQSPHVIAYKDSFLEQSMLCIVMAFADGGDLYQMIESHKKTNDYIDEKIII